MPAGAVGTGKALPVADDGQRADDGCGLSFVIAMSLGGKATVALEAAVVVSRSFGRARLGSRWCRLETIEAEMAEVDSSRNKLAAECSD